MFAAADGQVVYAGDGIRGYGNLVVLEHAGDLLTVYAHNSRAAGARRGRPVRDGRSHRAGRPERARDAVPTCTSRSGRARFLATPCMLSSSRLPPEARHEQTADPDARALALLRARVRDVPDFPKPGILFRDLTPLMGDGAALREAIDLLAERDRRAIAPS